MASGLLFVVGGAIVLIYPAASPVTLTWLLGIVLPVTGVVLIAQGPFRPPLGVTIAGSDWRRSLAVGIHGLGGAPP
jgi:hypothetical protein